MSPSLQKKSHCIGFITGKVPPIFEEKVSKSLTAVFVPTAPHPISGYLILVPEDEIKKINMSNEDAVKFTVSCGVILPEDNKVKS